MKCTICGTTVESIENAIDLGWIPSFWEEDNEYGPACTGCSETLIQVGQDGEFELKEEYQGKIIYQEGDYSEKEPEEHLAIGIIIPDTGMDECH